MLHGVGRARGLALALLASLALLGARPVLAEPPPAAPEPLLSDDAPDPLFDEDAELLAEEEPLASDPWEGLNRGVFSLNRSIDRFVLNPVTDVYQLLVPEPGRRAIHRAIQNLDSPVVFANHLLQLRFDAAAVTLGRFVVNTTAGVGGLFDAAYRGAAIERVEGDFGQTLAVYGVPSGPYVMLPLFGPSTLRDTAGGAVDAMGDPLTYVIGPFRWWTLGIGAGEGLVVREANVGDLRELEEGSLDFYSALRSAYLQSRAARIREARGGTGVEVVVQGD